MLPCRLLDPDTKASASTRLVLPLAPCPTTAMLRIAAPRYSRIRVPPSGCGCAVGWVDVAPRLPGTTHEGASGGAARLQRSAPEAPSIVGEHALTAREAGRRVVSEEPWHGPTSCGHLRDAAGGPRCQAGSAGLVSRLVGGETWKKRRARRLTSPSDSRTESVVSVALVIVGHRVAFTEAIQHGLQGRKHGRREAHDRSQRDGD